MDITKENALLVLKKYLGDTNQEKFAHSIRVAKVCKILAEKWDVSLKDDAIIAGLLHDIGKIATPDNILQKPGKLTNEEFNEIKKHAAKGGEIIKETFKDIDDKDFLIIAYECARFHHEKYNGKGYPEGLKEDEIPLHARIMAIADVFDAVSAKRCYRDALPLETCFKIIEEGRGTDFDPNLVDLFLENKDEVISIYNENK